MFFEISYRLLVYDFKKFLIKQGLIKKRLIENPESN